MTGKPETDAQPPFAYLPGLCFPKKRDEQKNAGTLELVTQDRSVIHRADGVRVGIEAT